MALKATIYKASIQLADMDRSLYTSCQLTLARHPSETDERMMIRLLAFALHLPPDDSRGALEFAKDLWDADEPALWHRDYTGILLHWMDVGQPDDRRIIRAAGRAERVTVFGFASSTPVWWKGIQNKLVRARNVHVWQIEAAQSQALARLAARSMHLQVTVQDGLVTIGEGAGAGAAEPVEITPIRLMGKADEGY